MLNVWSRFIKKQTLFVVTLQALYMYVYKRMVQWKGL